MPQQIYGDPIRTIAANNTPKGLRSSANYICDGTNDQVELQAALDSLDATGGTVYLLPGTFNTAGFLTLGTNQRIVGSGWSSKIVYTSTVYAVTSTSSNVHVADVYIEATNAAAGPVSLTGGDSSLVSCYLLQNSPSATISTVVLGGTGSRIHLCHIVGSALGITIPSGWDDVNIGNNWIETNTGILLDGCSSCLVHNNIIRGNSAATGHGIVIQGDANDNSVVSNLCTRYGIDGIRLINVGGSTPDRNNIQNNLIRTVSGTAGDGYGINVLSGTSNLVTNNDLLSSGTLGAFNDAGITTEITAGNRLA